jgi:branched-chain amino acid transport system substrate-binding protein
MGILMSFTGPAALTSASNFVAIRMGVKEINDAGGLLGHRIEIVQADDQFNPAQAVSEARRLAQLEKVNFVLGPISSSLSLAVAPIFNEAKIVYFSTTVAVIPTPFNFSPMMSSVASSEAAVHFMKEVLKPKTVAVISDDGAASRAHVEDYKKEIPAQGMAITGIQEHESRSPDITPQLLSLKKTNPDVLMQVSSIGEDAGQVIKTLKDLGWDVPVVSASAGLSVGGALKIAGPDAFKSGRIYSLLPLAQTYCPNEKSGDGGYGRYVARLKAFDPADFDKVDHKLALPLYDSLIFLKAAVDATKSLDGPTLVAWMDKNASTVRGTAGVPFAAAAGSHFMMSADSLALVKRPDQARPGDNLIERMTNCDH